MFLVKGDQDVGSFFLSFFVWALKDEGKCCNDDRVRNAFQFAKP
jgi:hypothetical protein